MKEILAFIGGGQMAGSLIGGLVAAGHPASAIRVAEPDAARARLLRERFGVAVAGAGAAIVEGADALILAVKPQAMPEAVHGLRPGRTVTVVSIAAGVRIQNLRDWLGAEAAIVRCMPNTPALLRSGITGAFAQPDTPSRSRKLAEDILRSVGEVCWVAAEEQLDAVTALSGSGPAYFFLLVEALREAGTTLGLDRDTAGRLARRTFVGAAKMAEHETVDVAELRARVTSRGGTTEAAVEALESGGIRKLFEQALKAAERRARQLGEELSSTAR